MIIYGPEDGLAGRWISWELAHPRRVSGCLQAHRPRGNRGTILRPRYVPWSI